MRFYGKILISDKVKMYLLLLMLVINCKLSAQNLVPNDDLELFTSCPTNSGEIFKLLNWLDPTGATSDYYNTCGSGGANVPYCGNGFQTTYSGNGYAGLWTLNGIGNNFREYISVELSSILLIDRCYKLEFYANLHNYSGIAIKQLGMIVSDSLLTTPNVQGVLNYNATIEANYMLSDTVAWVKVSGYYTSQGGEKYITIGNFKLDSQTDTSSIPGNSYPGAYYLIDKVLVEEIPGCDTLGMISLKTDELFSIHPNPNNGLFNINNLNDYAGVFTLYDLRGSVVYSVTVNEKTSFELHLDLKDGIYFYKMLYQDNSVKTGKLSIIE